MILHPAMKNHFQLDEADEIMGQLFLGYSDEKIEGRRKIALTEKVIWER